MLQRVNKILETQEALEQKLMSGDLALEESVEIQKRIADMSSVVELSCEYRKNHADLGAIKEEIDGGVSDEEWLQCLKNEQARLLKSLEKLQIEIKMELLPKDEMDARGVILEVRAGTGGDEAALFASDLLRMYMRYASIQGWRCEVLSRSESELGGVKEVTLSISGANVYERMKFESGGHRVQRVPATESQGRVHTSAATVAVLPEVEAVDVVIDPSDLRIDVYRASGPGGQSVNTTDSAVRITHIPTGVVVQQQDEKSQHKNKEKAMKILRARLYEKKLQDQMLERSEARKLMVGSGDRSERVRTYNFPQDRFVDHRINLRLNDLNAILAGDKLNEVVESLLEFDKTERLAALDEKESA